MKKIQFESIKIRIFIGKLVKTAKKLLTIEFCYVIFIKDDTKVDTYFKE